VTRKPENTFISGVHSHLKDVYHEKMNNPFSSGTADVWYSGSKADLWVEYKYLPQIPKSTAIRPNLSERQRIWLLDRYVEGRRVAVVVGCPEGGVIWHPPDVGATLAPEVFRSQLRSRQQLADWIREHTGTSPCRLPRASSL
jgi:hypothetical protein